MTVTTWCFLAAACLLAHPARRHTGGGVVRFRTLHRIYAALFGYFWVPCPICDQEFGGQEWKDRNGNAASIAAPDREAGHHVAICPDCTKAGYGGPENIVIWTNRRPR